MTFSEQTAIMRTAASMSSFGQLDQELSKLDQSLSRRQRWTAPVPIASTSTLEVISSAAAAATAIAPPPSKLATLLHSLNPPPTGADPATSNLSHDQLENATDASAVIEATPALVKKFTSPDQLWWNTVASTSSTSALSSGIPTKTGFVDCGPSISSSATRRSKGKGKAKAVPAGIETNVEMIPEEEKRSKRTLGERMCSNVTTLSKIRRLHSEMSASSSAIPTTEEPAVSEDSDRVAGNWLSGGVDRRVFSTTGAEAAARESLETVSKGVLAHAGFDGTSEQALGVLASVAAEYVMNLGRTLRFYSDRYASSIPAEEILLHVLEENGVEKPVELEKYVEEDINRYGVKLSDLHSRLTRARAEQLARIARGEVVSQAPAEGDDEDGLTELEGIDGDVDSLSLPLRAFSTSLPTSSSTRVAVELKYPAPPPFVPLSPSALSTLPGLLLPFFAARQKTEYALIDDLCLPIRPKNTRAKVPSSGRIPLKTKRKTEDFTIAVGSGVGKKKRKAANEE